MEENSIHYSFAALTLTEVRKDEVLDVTLEVATALVSPRHGEIRKVRLEFQAPVPIIFLSLLPKKIRNSG